MSNVTLIIPTRNHPQHFKRMLDYYLTRGVSYKFIIVDSGSDENKQKTKAILEKSGYGDFLYLDDFAQETFYPIKVKKAFDYITTPYVLLGADDDFIIPESIDSCSSFLDKNSDYGLAQGIHYGFTFSKQGGKPHFFVLDLVYGLRTIKHGKSYNRLHDILTHYMSLFYAVYRTDNLKRVFEESVTYSSDYKFLECVMNSVALLLGKAKFIDRPHCFRELSGDSTGSSANSNWMEMQDFDQRLSLFRECLTKNLKIIGNEREIGLEERVDGLVREFVEYNRTVFGNAFRIQPSLLRSCAKIFLPRRMYAAISLLKKEISYERKKRELALRYARFFDNEHKEFYKDFIDIKNLIINSQIECSRAGIEDLPQIHIP